MRPRNGRCRQNLQSRYTQLYGDCDRREACARRVRAALHAVLVLFGLHGPLFENFSNLRRQLGELFGHAGGLGAAPGGHARVGLRHHRRVRRRQAQLRHPGDQGKPEELRVADEWTHSVIVPEPRARAQKHAG